MTTPAAVAPDPAAEIDNRPAAVIYTRVSQDTSGEMLAVQRQKEDCRAYAAEHGLRVVELYVDNDISAWNRRKKRPDYERLKRDLTRPGAAQIVIVYNTDRLHRQLRELVSWVDLADTYDISVHAVKGGGEIDLKTPAGRANAFIWGVIDQQRSDAQGDLLKRKFRQERASGHYQRGPLPFGWQRPPDAAPGSKAPLILHDGQAELVRWGIEHMLAGGTLGEVVRKWNDSPHKPPRRPTWCSPSVRQVLTRWRNGGVLVHVERKVERGKTVNIEKRVGTGNWDPIPTITEEKMHALRRIFAENAARGAAQVAADGRGVGAGRNNPHLLSGIALCGACGSVMMAASRYNRTGPARRQYICRARTRHVADIGGRAPGGGHASRICPPVDGYVREVVADELDDPVHRAKLLELFAPEGAAEQVRALQAEKADITLRLKRLRVALGEGRIDDEDFDEAAGAAKARREVVDQLLAGMVFHSATVKVLSGEHPGQTFMAQDLTTQRSLLRNLVTITIVPVGRGNWKFDSSKIEITWKA